jgi:PAS domain S-box-containing protein
MTLNPDISYEITGRQRVGMLVFIMILISLLIGGVTLSLLYNTAFDQYRAQLLDVAKSRASLISSIAKFDKTYSSNFPEGSKAATISQIRDAQKKFEGFGFSGEFTLAEIKGNNIFFILSQRHSDQLIPEPVPMWSKLAEPMRRALAGQSGDLIGLDYRGVTVLAAYEPVVGLDIGIVAKIDMSEIRAPFIKTGLMVGGGAIVLIAIAVMIFFKLSNPLILKILNTEKASQEVEKKRKELERIIDHSPVISFLWKNEEGWPVEYVSDSIRAFGYTPEDFYSNRVAFADTVHPDELERVAAEVKQYSEEGRKNFTQEYRMKMANDEYKWIDDRTWIRRDESGNITHYQGIVLDISERKKAEENLLANEHKIKMERDQAQQYLDISPVMFCILDKRGDLVLINQKGCQLLGYEESEILNKNWFDLLIPNDSREKIISVFSQLMAGEIEAVEHYENTLITKTGEARTFSFHNSFIRDEKSNISGVLFSAEDITEKISADMLLRKNEEDLYRQQKTLEDVERMSHTGGWEIEIATMQIKWTEGTYRIHEVSEDFEPNLENAISFYTPESRAVISKAVEDLLENGTPFDQELSLITATGRTIFIRALGEAVYKDGKRVSLIGTFQDITELRVSEEALLSANRALRTISKANEALVHATTEEQLLKDVCRIVVEEGGFRSAWVGLAENDPDKSIRVVSQYGQDQGFLKSLKLSWSDESENGHGPAGTTFREGKPCVISNIQEKNKFTSLRHNAIERGFQSFICLPLLLNGESAGVFSIYANKVGAFNDDNIPLLMELTQDLAFGLMALRNKTVQKQTEEMLRWDVAVDSALTEVSRTILEKKVSIDKIAAMILDQVLTLTNSQFGFVGYIDPETGFLVCPTFTRDIWDECQVENKSAVFEKFTGLFGWVLNNKKPLMTNDPKRDLRSIGTPPGHIPIEKFLAVPALIDNELLGEIAIANPKIDYSERDQHLLERVANYYALAIQQRRSAIQIEKSELQFRALFDNTEISIWHEDLSDVHQALHQLRQQGVKDIRQYFENNEQAAWDIVGKVKVLQVNQATLKLFGAKNQKEMILSIDKVFGPETINIFINELCAFWNKDRIFRSETTLKTFDGRNIDVIISFQIPDTPEGFESIPVSIIDITERIEAEQQLWQSQKVESIGNLAGGIAHDINNMLLPIQALTGMTLKEMPEDSRAFKRLEKVLDASNQAKNLVSQILTFSRKEDLKIELINLAKTIRGVIPLLRSTVPSSLKIKIQIRNIGDVRGDASQIHAVLMNLASNATDAMDGNVGDLSISLARRKVTKADAHLPTLTSGKTYALLRVKDNGHGMDKDTLNRLFDPFFTTKSPGEGTGLGLSIVHGIIAKHGGAILVNSKIGKGTTFEIFLPLVD